MAAAAALAVGCAPVTRVTLLPQADGSASSVIVTSKKGITRVSRPFDSAEIGPGKPKIQSLDARTVQQRYNRLLSVRPPPPERFTLYFESASSTHLTQKSHAVLIQIMQRLAYHPGGEIFITGDTDRASTADNDAPSLQRANIVRDMVIRHGIDPVRVHARGRGEHELAIQATDQVDEPGNRHVEVVVR
ncbi:MAG: OmpA family protein [Burkholderiaceae bacterium]|jgi:outer membrane protein OmpA-like peptidoglycan-associated protein|nr:OmpA family protein [Burkholderiaceae bacterium]